MLTSTPKDIPLGQPAPDSVLVLAILVTFMAHILFVALMVGGTILPVVAEITGRWRPGYDALALEIGKTITVNKSLAVVLGVGPLLTINTLYTTYFYSSNALTGTAWLMIVPLVTAAFLALYLHKYTWEALAARKGLHIAIAMSAGVILLSVPFIFLTNINLMRYPELWAITTDSSPR